ncbi:MAG: hypothetical protein K5756_04720 [Clostridiales bacterium]|nr:hypothetical protein [Clostridiales bacterium]
MSYKKLIKNIAESYKTTSKEVDTEIREAIKAAGYDVEPEIFIAFAVAKFNSEMKHKADFYKKAIEPYK